MTDNFSSTSAIVSIQSMNPALNLTVSQAEHIYVDICGKDMQKAIQHLLHLSMNSKRTQKSPTHPSHSNSGTNNHRSHGNSVRVLQKSNHEYEAKSSHSTNANAHAHSDANANAQTMELIMYPNLVLKKWQMQVIDEMGAHLQAFAQTQTRTNIKWIQQNISRMIDESAQIKRTIVDENVDLDFDIYSYIVKHYFNGRECDTSKCPSVINNRRDRMQAHSTSTTNHMNEYNNHGNNNNNMNMNAYISVLDSIHVSFMHGYNTGQKLYRNEKIKIEMQTLMSETNANPNEFHVDFEAAHIRQILSQRRRRAHSGREVAVQSKFVTIVNESESSDMIAPQNEDMHNRNKNTAADDQQQNSKKKKSIYYKFGYKFYYWPRFETDERRDEQNGRLLMSFWFIPKKYASFKDELLKHISLVAYTEQHDSALLWMESEYIRKHHCLEHEKTAQHYEQPAEIPMSVQQISSVLFHCNFTELCTMFSATFRKLRDREADETLKERNSEFREFSRLLTEATHLFGTANYDAKKITVFFHGVSIVMQFPSTQAKFLSPTSTTTALSVAINFGGKGIVLELQNNGSSSVRFFDCCVLSDFSNEAEKLFMQDSIHPSAMYMPFKSIRILKLKHNYEIYVITLSCLQALIDGDNARGNLLKLKKKHQRCLQFLIDSKLKQTRNQHCKVLSISVNGKKLFNPKPRKSMSNKNASADSSSSLELPGYVREMFDGLVEKTTTVKICVDLLNVSKNVTIVSVRCHYVVFREIFCELYSAQELEDNREQWGKAWVTAKDDDGHRKGFVQPIYALKIDLFFELFPNLTHLHCVHIPLTRKLMRYIFRLNIWDRHNKRRPHVLLVISKCDEKYKTHSDFTGYYMYNTCASEFGALFARKALIIVAAADQLRIQGRENSKLVSSAHDFDWQLLDLENEKHLYKQQMILNRRCFQQLFSLLDPKSEASMQLWTHFVDVFAHGRANNDLDIISLLFDIYSQYSVDQQLVELEANASDNQNNNQNGAMKDGDDDDDSGNDNVSAPPADEPTIMDGIIGFTDSSEYLQTMRVTVDRGELILHSIQIAMALYERIITPAFDFKAMQESSFLIDDNINKYIEYSLIVGQAINELLAANPELFPLQVDLMIIPHCFVKAYNPKKPTLSEIFESVNVEFQVCPLDTNDVKEKKRILKKALTSVLFNDHPHTDNNKKKNKNHQNHRNANGSGRGNGNKSRSGRRVNHQRIVIIIDRRTFACNCAYVYKMDRIMHSASGLHSTFATANFLLPDCSNWKMSVEEPANVPNDGSPHQHELPLQRQAHIVPTAPQMKGELGVEAEFYMRDYQMKYCLMCDRFLCIAPNIHSSGFERVIPVDYSLEFGSHIVDTGQDIYLILCDGEIRQRFSTREDSYAAFQRCGLWMEAIERASQLPTQETLYRFLQCTERELKAEAEKNDDGDDEERENEHKSDGYNNAHNTNVKSNINNATTNTSTSTAKRTVDQTIYPWVGACKNILMVADEEYDFIPFFVVSYQCPTWGHNVRLQWFWNGMGMRFHPELMAVVWPHVFVNYKIEDQFKDVAFLISEFGLECKNTVFDQWYHDLTTVSEQPLSK